MNLADLRQAIQHLLPESEGVSWWLRRDGRVVEVFRVGGAVDEFLMAQAIMATPAINNWFAHNTADEIDGWKWSYSTEEPVDGVPLHGDWDTFAERLATVTTTIPTMPRDPEPLTPTRPQQAAAGALSALRFGAGLLERLIRLLERRGW